MNLIKELLVESVGLSGGASKYLLASNIEGMPDDRFKMLLMQLEHASGFFCCDSGVYYTPPGKSNVVIFYHNDASQKHNFSELVKSIAINKIAPQQEKFLDLNTRNNCICCGLSFNGCVTRDHCFDDYCTVCSPF